MIVALVAAFLGAFFLLRHRSTFRAIEAQRDTAAVLAGEHALPLADVLALRDLVSVDVPVERWRAAVAQFAQVRPRLGDALAAVAVAGAAEAVEVARAGAADADAAWRQFRVDPRALPGLRFLELRQRFAARIEARD